MIYFIAPYTKKFLGASQKIESLIRIMLGQGREVLLISTVAATDAERNIIDEFSKQAGFNYINIYDLGLTRNSLAYQYKKAYSSIVKRFCKPELLWLYNSYFTESIFAGYLKRKAGCKLVLEFEDWHFSRGGYTKLKSLLDYVAWRLLMPNVDYVFAVNRSLIDLIKRYNAKTCLLPGIISQKMIGLTQHRKFSQAGKPTVIGYFGGISEEKGGKVLLRLAELTGSDVIFHITGTGDLQAEFVAMREKLTGKFNYYGRVDNEQLYKLMSACDVLLNPHASITEMHNGVFPFKVLEYIASRALLISTNLPAEGFDDILKGVYFIENDIDNWRTAVGDAGKFYNEHYTVIEDCASKAVECYSENAVAAMLANVLG